MRLRTLQKLLYCSDGKPWIDYCLYIRKDLGGIDLEKELFLIEKPYVKIVNCSLLKFYESIFH